MTESAGNPKPEVRIPKKSRPTRDLSVFQGLAQFGRAYGAMLERDAHAAGSVDRVLAERMIRLCPETADWLYAGHTPTRVDYRAGSRSELEKLLFGGTGILACPMAGQECPAHHKIEAIARFCAALGKDATSDLDAMRVGGTEEEIITRGSDWCTDVARVGCVLVQIAGLPSRVVNLFNLAQAYSGHVIIEVFRDSAWGAVDVTTAVVYRHPDGQPATTRELMNHPRLIEEHAKDPSAFYTTAGQFRAAAISNYFVADRGKYDYTVSPLNDYYRSILEMSTRGWPGGLRWLFGEDR